MPTIGNLPGADIDVQFPSGNIKTVNMIILLVQTQNAEFKSKTGFFLPGIAKQHPTLKALREQYEIPANVSRTWKQMAVILRNFHTELSDHIEQHRRTKTA